MNHDIMNRHILPKPAHEQAVWSVETSFETAH